MKEDIKVSVVIVTYNHAKFISQCIESIMNQNTSFPYEILIGEDDSKDSTRKICKDFAKKYPEKIRLFLRNRQDVIYINGHPTGRYNFVETLKQVKGKYIALCDGDDYWTDSNKLEKLVSFLESHNEISLCYHNCLELSNNELKAGFQFSPPSNQDLELSFFLKNGFLILTCSIVFNSSIVKKLPLWFNEIGFADHTLYLMALREGKIKYFDEPMGVYRRHPGGATAKRNGLFWANENIKMYTLIKEEFPASTHSLFEQTILRHQLKKANYYLSVKEKVNAWKVIKLILSKYIKLITPSEFFSLSKMLAKLVLP